jgi:hypothetical protein
VRPAALTASRHARVGGAGQHAVFADPALPSLKRGTLFSTVTAQRTGIAHFHQRTEYRPGAGNSFQWKNSAVRLPLVDLFA